MITELKIENFKSFGSATPPLSLCPLNFVVGANATGKTNLLSSLRFLKMALLGNVESAVAEFGSAKDVRNNASRGRRGEGLLCIAVKIGKLAVSVGVRGLQSRTIRAIDYAVTIDLRSGNGLPVVQSETFLAEIEGPGIKSPYTLKRTRQIVRINDTAFGQGKKEFPVPGQDVSHLVAGTGFFSRPCAVFRDIVQRWCFFDINAETARASSKEVPNLDLGIAGEHLAVILHRIEKRDGGEGMNTIIQGLRGVVPGFKGIRTRELPVEGGWVFQVLEEKIRGVTNPRSVSDGTIRLLALMVIAHWSARRSTLLAIEEPENGLHPHLSKHIVELLRYASRTRQVLVTTHNPDFLDELEPEEVILCDKEEGFTVVRHASDVADIKSFRKHFRLGELWEQGTLGGIP